MYKVARKELLEVRNKIFAEKGIPALNENGFIKSPYSTAWYGRDNHRNFVYDLCRLSGQTTLEMLNVFIIRGDRRIQIYLNVFKLSPSLQSVDELNGLNSVQFHIPPNSLSRMQLRSDDYKGIPLFYMLFCPKHKLKSYYTKRGFQKRVKELGDLIEKDMTNIDSFVRRWHELHKPMATTWEGDIVGLETMTPYERLVHTNLLEQFETAKRENKERGEHILGWLKVDKATIKKMLESP